MRSEPRPRLLIVSFSPLRSDARVLRQVRLFAERYAVTTLGYGEAPDGVVEHLRLPDDVVAWHKDRRLLATRRFETAYRASPVVRATRTLLEGRRGSYDVVLANDADTLPVALDLAPAGGLHLDLHEYASRQSEESWRWRLFVAPYYRWLLRRYAPAADSVSTVGTWLAREYRREFGLGPVVVPNAAPFADRSPTPVGSPLRLVHSGLARRGRSLYVMIEAVRAAARPLTLDLYLMPNDPGYLQELRELAADLPRVRFHDPVPPDRLGESLAACDVGVFVLPPVNFNYRFTLPNKFFDFVQARLAVVVGPSPEMADLVRHHGLGVVTEDFTAESLAAALDALTDEQVAGFKAASHAAASELSAQEQVRGWTRAIDTLAARVNG
ncbi:glycosyltransferase [Ornithinimicrobium sp. LYQ121]|uniref:glycosyltransferase n=1 Tax=Ornithinimicrobium sp. LYQ121 TaxID=3378801 RepID=UPI00385377B6